MRTYPKIETLFDRNPETFKVDGWNFRRPEFAIIENWWVTEKIDGTNIRLHFERDLEGALEIRIGGRTDKAEIPVDLHRALLIEAQTVMVKVDVIMKEHNLQCYTLFGEGYGAKIQKGGGNYRPDQGFILFDVLVNDKAWLAPSVVRDTAKELGIKAVPVLSRWMSTDEIVDLVKSGFHSIEAEADGFDAEGVIAVPEVPLYLGNGQRVQWKLKHKDFA